MYSTNYVYAGKTKYIFCHFEEETNVNTWLYSFMQMPILAVKDKKREQNDQKS